MESLTESVIWRWKNIAKTGYYGGYCDYCRVYDTCDRCPIGRLTGEPDCWKTPYHFSHFATLMRNGRPKTFPDRTQDEIESDQAMYDWLIDNRQELQALENNSWAVADTEKTADENP